MKGFITKTKCMHGKLKCYKKPDTLKDVEDDVINVCPKSESNSPKFIKISSSLKYLDSHIMYTTKVYIKQCGALKVLLKSPSMVYSTQRLHTSKMSNASLESNNHIKSCSFPRKGTYIRM